MTEVISLDERSGSFEVRVKIDDATSALFNFDHRPEQFEIDICVKKYIDNRTIDRALSSVEESDLRCTAWQIRKALNQIGLRDAVENAVKRSESMDMKDGWNYSPYFSRYDPMVVKIGTSLGVSESKMDNLFFLAKSL